MRRYMVTEAPRPILIHELGELIRREEHLNPDRPDRAEAYRRALAELEMGAPSAWARRTHFILNEDHCARYGVAEGSIPELAALFEQAGKDRAEQGKRAKAQAIAEALVDLTERGCGAVRVEGVVYRVVED